MKSAGVVHPHHPAILSWCSRNFVRKPALGLLAVLASTIDAQAPRRMVPADLERLRPIWTSALSPDGAHVAMVVGRTPTIRSPYRGRSELTLLQRDVWVAPTKGGRAINITQGDRDASTSWVTAWSPAGKRLATLTTKGTVGRVRILVWTAGDTRPVVVSETAVYQLADARRTGDGDTSPMVWLTDDDLLFVGVDDGDDATTIDAAPVAWQKTSRGHEVSSSVLESGAARSVTPRRWATLQRVHIPTSRVTTIARIPPEYQRQTSLTLVTSPTQQHVAVIGDIGPNQVPASVPMSGDNERRVRVAIISTNARLTPRDSALAPWVSGVAGPQGASVRWSPDGQRIALLGKRLSAADSISDPGTPSSTVFVAGTNGEVRAVAPDTLRATVVEWAGDNRLLVRGRFQTEAPTGKAPRDDWWRIDLTTGERSAVTDSLRTVPSSVVRLGRMRFVGLADTILVAFDTAGRARPLTLDTARALRTITWPRRGAIAGQNTLVVEGGARSRTDATWYQVSIDGDRARVTEILRPSPGARFVGAHVAPTGSVLVASSGAAESGTFMWAREQGQPARTIFANNEFIAGIASGQRRMISYRSTDGDSLTGALLLPPDYRDGTRIPVLLWVYGGTTVSDTSFIEGKHGASLFNAQLFAAKGVGVLFPSVPLAPYGSSTAEPMTDVAKSVMPAVDRLVELGIADPKRIAVAGVSYGAYSVYALLTQTTRFRAAIAIDGDADLFTSYVAFNAAERYFDGVHERREGNWWAEASQGRMGISPWRDPLRYVRNSPFFALDRITTPLLIVHCDLDFVPITHAEEMFAGLYRLGKTARFVRYFGEGHGPYSPANLQHVWTQFYRWLDEFLLTVPTP